MMPGDAGVRRGSRLELHQEPAQDDGGAEHGSKDDRTHSTWRLMARHAGARTTKKKSHRNSVQIPRLSHSGFQRDFDSNAEAPIGGYRNYERPLV